MRTDEPTAEAEEFQMRPIKAMTMADGTKVTILMGRDDAGEGHLFIREPDPEAGFVIKTCDKEKAISLIAMNAMPRCLLDAAAGLLLRGILPRVAAGKRRTRPKKGAMASKAEGQAKRPA